jgi:hypothetical protein
MHIKVRTATEVVHITVGKEGRYMSISHQRTKGKEKIQDKVVMLDRLNHYTNIGTVIDGDVELLRRVIKGQSLSADDESLPY